MVCLESSRNIRGGGTVRYQATPNMQQMLFVELQETMRGNINTQIVYMKLNKNANAIGFDTFFST